jgi:ubiquinone/menaquinone biosynthesis C-methylase UbiE
MANDPQIDREKVRKEFDERAQRHHNMNAVLDAGKGESVAHQNIFRDYISKTILKSDIKPDSGDVILDFGCGVGRLTGFIAKYAGKVVGLEVSVEMHNTAIDLNTRFTNVSFCLSAGNKIPYNAGSFDKVFTYWVLQHIDNNDLEVIIAEFSRVMKNNGRLFIYEQIKNKRVAYDQIHIMREVNDYVELFSRHGFVLQRCKPVLRMPSYGMTIWKKFGEKFPLILPFCGLIEKLTVKRKMNLAIYYTYMFEFGKLSEP